MILFFARKSETCHLDDAEWQFRFVECFSPIFDQGRECFHVEVGTSLSAHAVVDTLVEYDALDCELLNRCYQRVEATTRKAMPVSESALTI